MKTKSLFTAALALVIAASMVNTVRAAPPKMKMTTPIPEAFTAPNKVKTSIGTLRYFDGVPSEQTTEASSGILTAFRRKKRSIPSTTISIRPAP